MSGGHSKSEDPIKGSPEGRQHAALLIYFLLSKNAINRFQSSRLK